MYLWSIKNKLPPFLGDIYAALFGYGRTPSLGLESFAQLIFQYRPTVVCLQEVSDAADQKARYGKELEKIIGSGYMWFLNKDVLDNRAILIQKEAVSSNLAQHIMVRGGTSVGIAYKLNHPRVWVASVHLRYSNLLERTEQLEELLYWASSKKEPVLLAGDFNTHIPWASLEKQQAAYHTFDLLRQSGFLDLAGSVNCTWRWGRYLPGAGNIKLDHFFGKGMRAVQKPVAVREHLRGWMDHLALFGPKFVVE